MNCTVDIEALLERNEAAAESLRAQPAGMRRIVAAAATEERRTHGYQNRTGDAQRSTKASPLQKSGDESFCTLEIGVDYAVYLNARGLTRIDEIAQTTDIQVQAYFADELNEIAGR